MAAVDNHDRPEPPLVGDETSTLLGFLEYQRATFAWKCQGLDAAGMRATLPPTRMTLGGLLKHVALVEHYWFSERLRGNALQDPWDSVDWDGDPDWEWRTAGEDSPEQLHELWHVSVARSRAMVTEALSDGGLQQLALRPWPDGSAPSLRWIVCHMIEE
jgi:uncharacterized damage-inducible protein DinB